MDLKKVRSKLVGNDENRAVSPVIGVILMVAVTVILAAIIATMVMDMGNSVESQAQGGVTVEGDGTNSVTVQAESLANADGIAVIDANGAVVSASGDLSAESGSFSGASVSGSMPLESVGQSVTYSVDHDADGSGTQELTVIAYYGDSASQSDRSGESVLESITIDETTN